jgi:L-threonylcarbamoyladenylate synthase
METFTKSEVTIRKEELLDRIDQGELFIHPTDTIYGIGCNALDEQAIEKVRKLKERTDVPFSIWAPNKEWIKENCYITAEAEKWLQELPGPYTLVLKLKNKNAIAPSVNSGKDSIGVRIPSHWFSNVVEEMGIPLITTSANRAGRRFMTTIEELDPEIQKGIRFTIYEGEKSGRPSKIIHLEEGERIQER